MEIDLTVVFTISEILDFYDANRLVKRHANSFKTTAGEELSVALLVRYFQEQGLAARPLEGSCTAVHGGAWLDKWVQVEETPHVVHYQVEVKSWSFHGYSGGQVLPILCNATQLRQYKEKERLRYWDDGAKRFKADGLDEVLKKMKTKHTGPVHPLACVRAAVHPKGNDLPFFRVSDVANADFKHIYVFPVSAYLCNYMRDTQMNTIVLDLPDIEARMSHLSNIFTLQP